VDLKPWVPSAGTASSKSNLIFAPTSLADYQEIQSRPGAFVETVDPLGSGKPCLQLTVLNTDGTPITPTEDPRGHVITPALWYPNAGFWGSVELFFPNTFPALVENKFFQCFEYFGLPFEGSAPFSIFLRKEEGEEFYCWQRNATYEFDMPWAYQALLRRGAWEKVLFRVVAEEGGWIELWWNGVQIEFFNPAFTFNPKGHERTKRLVMKTVDASNNKGSGHLYTGQYRKKGLFETATNFFTHPKIGLTKASVE
jgi:hypothetical protein